MGRHLLDAFLASVASGLAPGQVAHVAERASVTSGHQRHAAGHDCDEKSCGLPCERSVRFVARNSPMREAGERVGMVIAAFYA